MHHYYRPCNAIGTRLHKVYNLSYSFLIKVATDMAAQLGTAYWSYIIIIVYNVTYCEMVHGSSIYTSTHVQIIV